MKRKAGLRGIFSNMHCKYSPGFSRISRFSRNAPIFAAHIGLLANFRDLAKTQGGVPLGEAQTDVLGPAQDPEIGDFGRFGPQNGVPGPPILGVFGVFWTPKIIIFPLFWGFPGPKKSVFRGSGSLGKYQKYPPQDPGIFLEK